jgi:hypothetical protein
VTTATVTIPANHYTDLLLTAAELEGKLSAEELGAGEFHPGSPLGVMLCEARRVDGTHPVRAMADYMNGLRSGCAKRGTPAPSLATVLDGLRRTIDSDRYPDVDVDELIDDLRAGVPEIYGFPKI